MPNAAEVSFSLFGEGVDPSVLTREIGLTPTSLRQEHTRSTTQTRWTLTLGPVEGGVLDVYEMAANLVATLRPHQADILRVKLASGLEAMLQVVLRIDASAESAPMAIGFEPEVVAFLALVGASIDIDTYLH